MEPKKALFIKHPASDILLQQCKINGESALFHLPDDSVIILSLKKGDFFSSHYNRSSRQGQWGEVSDDHMRCPSPTRQRSVLQTSKQKRAWKPRKEDGGGLVQGQTQDPTLMLLQGLPHSSLCKGISTVPAVSPQRPLPFHSVERQLRFPSHIRQLQTDEWLYFPMRNHLPALNIWVKCLLWTY